MDDAVKAAQICTRAAELVSGDRARQHGPKHGTFGTAAQLWSAYLCVEIDPVEVAICIGLLKLARTRHGEEHNDDNFIDLAGYAGLAGELAAAAQPQDDEQ